MLNSASQRLLQSLSSDSFAVIDGADSAGRMGVWILDTLQTRIQARSATQVMQACAEIDQASAKQHVLLLLDYELGYWLEPVAAKSPPTIRRPPLSAYVFRRAEWMERDCFGAALSDVVDAMPADERRAGIAGITRELECADYCQAVERILRYIHDGDCYQIDFTWPLRFRCYGDPLALYCALRKRQPVRHGAFVRLAGRTVLSLSPELFLERRSERLSSKPMKGTAQPGANEAEDRAIAVALRASEKDRAENVMIVDLIRNDMGRLARPGTVQVESLFAIETYPTVLQMVSTVSAQIGNASLYEILRALFPCGSVTGAPKIRAMQIAQELETGPRGLYTGSIGHIRPGRDFDFNVAIRTIELDQDGRGRLGIGSGIVADSDPQREYEECLAKAKFVTDTPADFELIETLRLEPMQEPPYPYLRRHLERLGRSAECFGFDFSAAQIEAALADAASAVRRQATHRVRLTLAKEGTLDVQSAVLTPLNQAVPLTVIVAEERLDSRNLFLRHKTTVRTLYERKLAEIAALPNCFDALFFNERGELCEGARSNVFLVRNQRWFTPPLECGVLDGVMRRVVLESKGPETAEERVLRYDDLISADEIYLCNALRGVFRVQLRVAPVRLSAKPPLAA